MAHVWDAAACGENIALSGATATHSSSSWDTVLGTRWMSGGVHTLSLTMEDVDNVSFFIGIVARPFWGALSAALADEEAEEYLPRNSEHAIVMHGDGRMFLKGKEKDWGMLKLLSGDQLTITCNFRTGVATFAFSRMVKGQAKECLAEVPGLFPEACLVLCFGGRRQQITITGHEESEGDADAQVARDAFADVAEGTARIQLDAGTSHHDQLAAVAQTLE